MCQWASLQVAGKGWEGWGACSGTCGTPGCRYFGGCEMNVCLEMIFEIAYACRLFSTLIEQPSTSASSVCTSTHSKLARCSTPTPETFYFWISWRLLQSQTCVYLLECVPECRDQPCIRHSLHQHVRGYLITCELATYAPEGKWWAQINQHFPVSLVFTNTPVDMQMRQSPGFKFLTSHSNLHILICIAVQITDSASEINALHKR